MSFELCSIWDHSYKVWVLYQTENYQIDRLEIHFWGKNTEKPPNLVRGYRILNIKGGQYRYCHCLEADNLIHSVSYLYSNNEDRAVIDAYITESISTDNFKEVNAPQQLVAVH